MNNKQQKSDGAISPGKDFITPQRTDLITTTSSGHGNVQASCVTTPLWWAVALCPLSYHTAMFPAQRKPLTVNNNIACQRAEGAQA